MEYHEKCAPHGPPRMWMSLVSDHLSSAPPVYLLFHELDTNVTKTIICKISTYFFPSFFTSFLCLAGITRLVHVLFLTKYKLFTHMCSLFIYLKTHTQIINPWSFVLSTTQQQFVLKETESFVLILYAHNIYIFFLLIPKPA